MRLIVEHLGPLRGTTIDFGDVTILFGLPNTGKSYLLRAVYAAHLHLDPLVLRWCISTKRLDEALGERIEVDNAPPRVEKDGSVICAEYAEARIPLEALATALHEAINRCVAGPLLPRDARYRLEGGLGPEPFDPETLQRLLRRLVCGKAVHLRVTKPGGCNAAIEGGVLRIRLSPVRATRMRRLWALGILSASTLNRMAAEAESALVPEEEVDLEMVVRALVVYALHRALLRLAGRQQRVAYAAYGRSLVTQALLHAMLRPEERAYTVIKEALGSRSLPALSLLGALTLGYRILVEDEEARRESELLFGALLGGGIRLAPGSIEYVSDGVTVPLHLASALVGEVTGLMLASAPLLRAGGGFLLVEEPEAQLHPRMHTLLPIVFYALAARGVKVALTTHSDILVSVAAALAALAERGAERLRDAVRTLLERFALAEPPHDVVEHLSSLLSEKLPGMKIRFYYVGGGEARELKPEEVLRNIPSMTEVLHELTRWYLGA